MTILRVLLLLGAVALALGSGATGEQLSSRASFDLRCPKGQLNFHQIDDRTYGVRGCGRQATYIESCRNANRTNCTWVLNSQAR